MFIKNFLPKTQMFKIQQNEEDILFMLNDYRYIHVDLNNKLIGYQI